MTQKTTDQNICFLNERKTFNLQCRFNESGIKIQALITIKTPQENSSEYMASETLDCQALEVGVWFQSKIRRKIYLQGTVVH